MPLFFLRRILPSLLAAATLAACGSSPSVRYHTLQAQAAPLPAGAATGREAGFVIDVLPVTLASRADQPQLLVRTSSGELNAWYSERWSAPLGDEIRDALSQALQRELGVPDVQAVKAAEGQALWRVQADVQRFELGPDRSTLLDVTWRIRPVNMRGAGAICRDILAETAGDAGAAALVAGQQRALSALAARIAAAISGQPGAAGGPGRAADCTTTK